MKQYFDRFGTLKERKDDTRKETRPSEAEEVTIPNRFQGMGMGLMMQAMIAKSKGNVRICTDMIEDEGVVIDKEKLCL